MKKTKAFFLSLSLSVFLLGGCGVHFSSANSASSLAISLSSSSATSSAVSSSSASSANSSSLVSASSSSPSVSSTNSSSSVSETSSSSSSTSSSSSSVPASSSSTPASSSSLPASSSPISSSVSSIPAQKEESYFRVAPAASSSSNAPIYSVSYEGNHYAGHLVKTLSKGTYYTSYDDVAAYWQAFGEMPANYMCADGDDSSGYQTTKNKAYVAYGTSARLWFTYHRTSGYMNQVPVYNTYGDGSNKATYFEIDISTNWSSYSGNRGAERLMAMPYGLTEYGDVPVIFHTTDHYDTFTEYLNYSSGWGTSFSGRSDYSMPATVSYNIA